MISIITPVFNGKAHIGRTLDSLGRQTVPFEHLVMDAASPDGTAAIARGYASVYNVQVFSEPDEGHFDAVQKGFARAQGDILGWINAGDFYMPWTLAVVQRIFDDHPEVEWITGIPSWYYEDTGVAITTPFAPVYLQGLIRRGWYSSAKLGFLQQESMFWRRSLWERSGAQVLLKGQGKGKGYATDYWLWRRFAEHARLDTVSSVFSCFSISAGQITERLVKTYLAECGLSGDSMSNPRSWRLAQRLISTSGLFGRAIHPAIPGRQAGKP
jgi:glycosyltransferase involved in cell wall biosynthesis